jgi:D-aminoacyl-tRNA deacylase
LGVMRAVIQRVSRASVTITDIIKSEIGCGLLVLIGIEDSDGDTDIEWLCNKIVHLRIFDDKNEVMNLSVKDVDGNILAISQFTLHAKTRKGNRPSYIKAANPDIAIPLYKKFVRDLSLLMGKEIGSGEFGAMMEVELVNDGPVTIIIDTKAKE